MKRFTNSLSFLGGTETVTGSRYLIEVDQQRYLVDCGLFQGYKNLRERNRADFPVPADTIDFILLTHAHLDHSGYVPAMIRQGFKGRILTTPGTAELLSILWPDSAHLLEEDAERANRKGYTKHAPAKPLYDIKDVEQALQKIKTVPFGKAVELASNVSAEFQHAGHILGAAQLHMKVNNTSIHFSGDLGRASDSVMNPPAKYPGSDILVVESTYGDRTHPKVNPEDELAEGLGRGGDDVHALLREALAPLAQHPQVKHFRQQGMIWAFDAQVQDPAMAATFSRRFFTTALAHELLIRPIGRTVYVMPPYILSDDDIDLLATRLHTVFEQVVHA